MAQMKVQSVRFGDYQWTAIAEAAKSDGVAAWQFIRDAAWARAVVVLQQDPRMAFAFDLARAAHSDLSLAPSACASSGAMQPSAARGETAERMASKRQGARGSRVRSARQAVAGAIRRDRVGAYAKAGIRV